jgi:hypothetical protein
MANTVNIETNRLNIEKLLLRYIVAKFALAGSWYEVCNDGWVRQSGITGTLNGSYITSDVLTVPMKDTSYYANGIPTGYVTDDFIWVLSSRTTTTVSFRNRSGSGATGTMLYIVEGYGSSSWIVTNLGFNPGY